MKKYILILALIIFITVPAFADTETSKEIKSFSPVVDVQKQLYQSPLSQTPGLDVNDESTNNNKNVTVNEFGEIEDNHVPSYGKNMPMFKRARIHIMNYFRQKDINKYNKYQESTKSLQVVNSKNKDGSVSLDDSDEDIINNLEVKAVKDDKSKDNIQLSGGVKEHVTTNDVILDSDNVDFNDKTMDVVATGHPVLTFPPQNTTLKADKIIYNNVTNILKAYDNVELIKDGSSIYGDFMQINMNEENAFADNMKTTRGELIVHAKHATADDKLIVLNDGKLTASHDFMLSMETSMVAGFDYKRMIIDENDKSYISDISGSKDVHVNVNDIDLNAKKQHNVLTFKDIEVYNGKHHLFDWASFEAHTNKDHNYFEGNYPELGSRNPMGMYIGPGRVFDLPNGATLKAIPLLNYKSKFGIGGALKYKSPTNVTDFMYGSANDVFVLKGKQYLDDKFYLQYGMNAFLDEWFLGARMPKYAIEAVYEDRKIIPNSLGKNLNLTFKDRFSAGYFGDTKYQLRDESLPQGKSSTVRLRYMAELNQSLFHYENRPQRELVDFGIVMQGSTAVYGTGDTQFIGRIGPMLHTQYKYWMQNVGYFASAYQDQTPLIRYDTYRYGHSNVYLNEAIRLNKWLALGWTISANLLKEAPNGKLLQENGFLVSIGPDEFKVNLGYDFIREATYFNITMGINVKNSDVTFKKMVIKNPDRLSNDGKPELKLLPKVEDFQTAEKSPAVVPLQYAQVIEIQDPEREYVQ